ncbi:hypothetical protein BU23DRAFT_565431 [Bimuria novae-zelandiae CBS 107.79]|uniref:DUF3176 domain containing protein n=1 Tax=Bimuria novae-zelandiae CBS 107.79 TaxID=1447943 RepID=A0A6A5VID1_9PLEO|nr:hypothetical protein BU23DRAFT_565431 [Bimuria novae-zelandiae CBS 107.79]
MSIADANIAIYLDSTQDQTSSKADEDPEHICPKCSASSKNQPIHCISVSTPAPPSYHTVVSQPRSAATLSVPILNLQTPDHRSIPVRPHRPAPAFRRPDEGRLHVRFRGNGLSPVSPQTSEQGHRSGWETPAGLGIPDAPFKPDISPITPGIAGKAEGATEAKDTETSEASSGASNLGQWIEQKLWKYSASPNVVKRWLMEIISWTLSALSMAGIVVVLYHYQHQPLPRWPLGLTLNAYISVLAKVSGAALLLPVSEALGQLKWIWFRVNDSKSTQSKKMWDFELFDNASRGPWGSFMLLLRTKGRSVAALGAAVTLFALAMDPFFQQVVDISEQWREQPTKALIPRATTYTAYTAGQYLADSTSFMEPDQAMSTTSYLYFYDNGTTPAISGKGNGISPQIPLACPSTNCTWPKHENLGVCNRCADVTDRLEFGCRDSTLDWVPVPVALPDLSNWDYPNGTACGWYLMADTPILMAGYNNEAHSNHTGEVLVSRSQPLYDLFTRAPLSGYAAKLNDTRNPISHFVVVSGGDVIQVRQNATPIAHECIISWCVKTMQPMVFEGAYTENVTDIVFNKTLGYDPWNVSVTMDGDEVVGSYFEYNENITIFGNSGLEFTLSNDTHSNILTIFDDIFPSTYTATNTTDIAQATLRFQQYITKSYRSRNKTYNPFLYNNITSHLDNLATKLTNIVRSAKGSIEMIEGPASDLVSVIEVRWEWLSLPLGLLVFSFIFLVATIVRSSMAQDVGVWKTSAIATLLYGLPDDVREKVTSAKDQGTPRANAKRTKVKWLPGVGWRLSAASAFSPSLRSRHTPPQPEWKE